MSVPTTITQITLKNPPAKEVNYEWDQEDSTFRLEKKEFDEKSVKDGEVLVKLLYLSNDPTQRTWMQKGLDATRLYAPPIRKDEAIRSLGLGEVLISKSSKYSVGDKVNGLFAWTDYALVNEAALFNKIDESNGLPLPIFLGSLGMTGLTAYFGLKEVGKFQKGQTVVVSAASGATGSMCVQIAKHILGASKVIGLSGSDDKCKWVESIGADICVNYNNPDYKEQLSKIIGTDFVDVYFDCVGGDMLSFMLTKVKRFGRIVACGSIAGYHDKEKMKVENWGEIITNRITVQGFIVSDFSEQFPEGIAAIVSGIQSGKIKTTESLSVIDLTKEKEPFKKVPEVWSQLFSPNKGYGKLVTKVA